MYELDAHRPVALVEQDPGGGRVQHYVEIRTVPGRAEEGARRGEPRAVSGRGLRYRESGVRPSVQIHRVVSWTNVIVSLRARRKVRKRKREKRAKRRERGRGEGGGGERRNPSRVLDLV